MRYLLLTILLSSFHLGIAQYKFYEDGLTKYQEKDYASSIKLLTDFLSKPMRDKKFDLDAYYYRALSYYKQGEHNSAVEDFQEAILLDHPNKGNIYWFMAKSQDKLSAYDESVNDYTNAIKELGSDKEVNAKLLYERSLEYSKLGKLTLAYEDLKNGHALSPGNTDIKKELDKLSKQDIASRTVQDKSQKPAQTITTTTPATTGKNDSGVKKDNEKKTTVVKKELETVKPAVIQQPATTSAPEQTQAVAAVPSLADAFKDEKRYALVIGNGAYPKSIGVLRNPVNDATDFAKELQGSNFEVQLVTNATYGQMRAAMLKFKEKVDAGDRDKTVSLFYYAGHGLQRDDENYLVPIDASIEYEDDIARYCFPVQRMVLANMERSNSRMNIVILDACRNNPFPALTRSLGEQGLGEMKRARGSFIAYATAPGSVASDGSGRNGLYTQELIKAMKKSGLTIEQVFKEVRRSVLRLSGDKQNTWDSSNIVGEFYFKF